MYSARLKSSRELNKFMLLEPCQVGRFGMQAFRAQWLLHHLLVLVQLLQVLTHVRQLRKPAPSHPSPCTRVLTARMHKNARSLSVPALLHALEGDVGLSDCQICSCVRGRLRQEGRTAKLLNDGAIARISARPC